MIQPAQRSEFQICLILDHANTALKKFAAIILIAILSFNWYGYRILTTILTQQSDKLLETRLDDAKYDESQLIEIRIALNVPYQIDRMEFERHYGEMEVDGKLYTYVKRKVENGILILKCIPNSSKQKIQDAAEDFFKQTTGLEGQHPNKKPTNNNGFAKNFWSEYDGRPNEYILFNASASLVRIMLTHNSALQDTYTPSPGKPPELI